MANTDTIEAYLDGIPEPLRAAAQRCRAALDAGLPGATGQMWHGHPVWMIGGNPVAGFTADSSYVTFTLWRGRSVDDASGRLESGDGEMASVKVRTALEVDAAIFAGWLRQAQALEALRRS